MYLNDKINTEKNNPKEVAVKILNKPTKEDAAKKVKELSEFLSETWHMPINSE